MQHRRRRDGVEDDALIQDDRAVNFISTQVETSLSLGRLMPFAELFAAAEAGRRRLRAVVAISRRRVDGVTRRTTQSS